MLDSLDSVDGTDIAIVGAGPVGLALACLLLRNSPWRLTLIDAATPARAARDPRAIALSHGSRQLLEQIGAWPRAVTPIEHIHVSQRGRFGHVRLHSDDYDVPALGYVVRYGDLCEALERALAQAIQQAGPAGERLARAYDTRIDHIEQSAGPDGNKDGASGGLVRLTGHTHDRQPAAFAARLAVQAEGGLFHKQSPLAGSGAQAQKYRRDYRQTAIVAHVACSRPQPGWAWERFTDEGPLALLPHEEHGMAGYALVWCCPPDLAARRLALPDAAFLAELEQAFGPRMGRFTGIGKRHAFPLGLNAAPVTVQGRVVAVGNAAQTLHPVAGQGLNLGLRDAFALGAALRAGCSPQALQAFAAQQKLDRAVTIGVTDLLPRVFGISYPLAAHARGASLAALACLGPLKDALARQMMYGMRR
ncbi:UbiH/UbiF/VisC/COQ6 family ubiquinone biosynthesis hydroxylase [Cupriavidus basilensis]|uniref:UbiH/UbiF/VisC/COQ6 family ubiquinone biosynthesis hydroxylase n=1 Tax=Cupriavidus basilensis TaxID=68895 RepID=A0ABT6B4H4_9BURK|nr:UbiH/UbiF/VisC/COQ6 family ubiquinone biosynthesis hydroxylase [Cupriavidus basilensis]MDF3839781.1 UbiH/UbiF/VisC/COQ6 family ubiquinone biosynthesis hydroxylase [Cupriavidus basilensis]